MNFPDLQLTDLGIAAIIGTVYADSSLTFTGVDIGDGTLPAGTDVKQMSQIISKKKTVGLTSCTVADKVATLTFTLGLEGLSSAFYLRELGIMATVNAGEEDEASILYAYTNAGSDAIKIKPDTSGNHAQITFTVHVAVGDAEEVEAVISDITGYVTQSDFEAHIHDYNNPHQATKEQVGLGNVLNYAPSDMPINFSQPVMLTVPTSGADLSSLMGKMAKAISVLLLHLTEANNPHGVDPEQIGAASANHTHAAFHITSGILPIARGGTGQNTDAGIAAMLAATVEETKQYLGVS